MEKIQRGILLSFVCDQFSYYVELLEEAGIQFTKPQFETFANRLCELNNHSHLWSNRGGQPVEMYDGLDNAELDAAAIMKTMQLDPDGYYRNPVLSRIAPKKMRMDKTERSGNSMRYRRIFSMTNTGKYATIDAVNTPIHSTKEVRPMPRTYPLLHALSAASSPISANRSGGRSSAASSSTR